jgi:predicted nucleic-acid-binding protein
MVLDTNAILRYLINDIPEQAEIVEEILHYNKVYLPIEILAETVYVLNSVYKINSTEIADNIFIFLQNNNIISQNIDLIIFSLNIYKSTNLSFIDCLLCGYKKFISHEIFTFDKELIKYLKKIE